MKTEKLTMRLAIVFVVVAIAASAVAAGLYAPKSIEKLLPNGDALEISVYDKETETETFLPADKINVPRSNTAYATQAKPLYLTARC